MRLHIYIILFLLLSIPAMAQSRMSRTDYVDKFKKWAIREMEASGIPASITIAQGILESDCGNSELATEANNHFGIKCHSDWTGETMHHDDDKDDECFRKYDNAEDSFRDHTQFLVTKSRYKGLFELSSTDYKAWATGLKAAGYATDPSYASNLIVIIEDLKLYELDYDIKQGKRNDKEEDVQTAEQRKNTTPVDDKKPVIKSSSYAFEINPLKKHKTSYNNGIRYIELDDSDSMERIAAEFHLLVSDLLSFNDLDGTENITNMKYLYLTTKRNRAHRDCPSHIVRAGDTPWIISQKYGIKLKKLCSKNGISPDEKLNIGSVIRLR